MSVLGKRAAVKERVFLDIDPTLVLQRKDETEEKGTIKGISSKFQYICKVYNIF